MFMPHSDMLLKMVDGPEMKDAPFEEMRIGLFKMLIMIDYLLGLGGRDSRWGAGEIWWVGGIQGWGLVRYGSWE